MINNVLNNNKLLEIKLVFAIISIALFYAAKLHIEYQYGRHISMVTFGVGPILLFYNMVSGRPLTTNYKSFIFPAIFSLSICFFACYLGVYTGGIELISVAAAKSAVMGICTAVGAVIGIVIYYVAKYYRGHDFSLESLLTVVATCAILGSIFADILFK